MLSKYADFNRLQINHKPEEIKYVPEYKFQNKINIIGIEVELENVININDDVYNFWDVVEDGSLKYKGREFTTLPFKAQYSELVLKNLFDNLNEDVAVSHRTSTHVHINFRKSSLKDIVNFVLLYLTFEPLMYEFVGFNRDKNIFCVPINKTWYYREINKCIAQLNYLPGIRWSKYSGMNLLPLFDGRGTIEFRQLARTKDIRKICVWIDAILTMKKQAALFETDELIKKLSGLIYSSQYEKFFWDIFGNNVGMAFMNYVKRDADTVDLIRDGVVFVRQCINFKDAELGIDSWKAFIQSDFGKFLNLKELKSAKVSSRIKETVGY